MGRRTGTAKHITGERALRRRLGEEHADQILWTSENVHAPVPVAGTELVVVEGIAIPRIAGGAITSLDDLISEAAAGKSQDRPFGLTGTLGVTGAQEDLWYVGGNPGVGATPSAVPGGSVPDRTTAGALGQANAGAGDLLYLTALEGVGSAGPSTLWLHDRLFHAALGMNSTAAQPITGVPTRNTNGQGNVMWIAARVAIAATAHNNTVVYTDQDGNAGASTGAVSGISGAAVSRTDHTAPFLSLASGDTGVRAITSYAASAAVATGSLDIVLSHLYAAIPIVPGLLSAFDGIPSMQQIPDGAALSFFGVKGTATATTYSGMVRLVSG